MKCIICTEKEFKYKCPGCEKKTCSLKCSLLHKKKFDCDGLKKPYFIPLREFKTEHLIQDINFLQGILNVTKAKPPVDINCSSNGSSRNGRLDKRENVLQKECSKRGIELIFMKGLHRNKRNKSYSSKNVIYWTVEWSLEDEKWFQDGVDERMNLIDILSRKEEYKFSMKDPKDGKYYYLDQSKCLEENLKSQRIFEFPTIRLELVNKS